MTNEQIARSMAYKNCFGSEHGTKVLEDLDRKCMLKGSGLYVSDNDRQTCFNLGMNQVIRYIHQEIDRNLTEEDTGKAKHKEII
jgi:hypothetical protein